MKKGILAIDQGTTSSRAIIFSTQGEPLYKESEEFECHFPESGWVEQNPLDLLDSVTRVCEKVVANAKADGVSVEVIGIANQRETSIIWDRNTGETIYPAIVWQDRRTSATCEKLKKAGHEEMVRRKTGLLLDPYFSATKIAWILDTVDGARQRAEKGELAFGTVDSYLMYHLSGGKQHVTDSTNASRTLLYNIYDMKWDNSLLELFNIPPQVLPTVLPCDGKFASTSMFKLEHEVAIHGCAGDQQAAAFGQGCFEPGELKSTYGTGCFILMQTGNIEKSEKMNLKNGLLTTVGYHLQSLDNTVSHALEGSIFNAGTPVQWLRDKLAIISDASEVESHANTLKDTGGVYFVPAFTGLGAPHWNPEARAIICGLTRNSDRSHIIRAAIEAVAYQTNDILQLFMKSSRQPECLLVDGGMTVNHWLMQFIADISGVPVKVAKIQETTALGAAMLAGLGAGIYSSLEEIKSNITHTHTFTSTMQSTERQNHIDGWDKAVGSVLSNTCTTT